MLEENRIEIEKECAKHRIAIERGSASLENCSINTPNDKDVRSVRDGDPVERQKKNGDSKQRVSKDTGR